MKKSTAQKIEKLTERAWQAADVIEHSAHYINKWPGVIREAFGKNALSGFADKQKTLANRIYLGELLQRNETAESQTAGEIMGRVWHLDQEQELGKGSLTKLFPGLSKDQRAEVRNGLKKIGFKVKGNTIG
ncbi:MAG: hypothetical protein ACAH80_11725 [Alphaproteobacteria bacterium]